MKHIFTIDVEEWFHILDAHTAPRIGDWDSLQLRSERSVLKILELLRITRNKATFFWLGWLAEKMPELVKLCREEGHEIASHGYAHVLAYKVGKEKFFYDISKGKGILEEILNEPIIGFRAAGFGITDYTKWAFDSIKKAGYSYDASVFPSKRGHGGMVNSNISAYNIKTNHGNLLEIPISVLDFYNKRFTLFGGGYLRITPLKLVHFDLLNSIFET